MHRGLAGSGKGSCSLLFVGWVRECTWRTERGAGKGRERREIEKTGERRIYKRNKKGGVERVWFAI